MKIPAIRIPSDACAVYVGRKIVGARLVEEGTPHFVHKGEWVEITPAPTVEKYLLYDELFQSAGQVGDDKKLAEAAKQMGPTYQRLLEYLAEFLVAWNWTDMKDKLMPQPAGNIAVLKKLSVDEVMYLLTLNVYEGGEERKNASEPLPTT